MSLPLRLPLGVVRLLLGHVSLGFYLQKIGRSEDPEEDQTGGAAPYTNRKVFFEASPISYATVDRNSTRFLLVHGTDDDIVDPPTQSVAFLNA